MSKTSNTPENLERREPCAHCGRSTLVVDGQLVDRVGDKTEPHMCVRKKP